jgi:hypothetical protein
MKEILDLKYRQSEPLVMFAHLVRYEIAFFRWNFRTKKFIIIYILNLTRNSCRKRNYRPSSGSCDSGAANWATESSCRAVTTNSCIYDTVVLIEGIWANIEIFGHVVRYRTNSRSPLLN